MRVIESVNEMQSFSESLRLSGKKIGFVPTMGYFHEGHLSLMREARNVSDCVVVSIYVNPTQFGPKEDFTKYPRDFDRDAAMAKSVDVDVIFHPSHDDMYPSGYQTYIQVERLSEHLCGLSRPGHFRGVATVCCKLFSIVKPHVAVFGQKDYQQLAVIRQMVADLNLDLKIKGMPTFREKDGLAMSSRNVYLSGEERASGLTLIEALRQARKRYLAGETRSAIILSEAETLIKSVPFTDIDYMKICDGTTLDDTDTVRPGDVMALAVRVGKTRLIDNAVLSEELEA